MTYNVFGETLSLNQSFQYLRIYNMGAFKERIQQRSRQTDTLLANKTSYMGFR